MIRALLAVLSISCVSSNLVHAALHPLFELDRHWQIVDPSEYKDNGCIDYMFLKSGKTLAGLRLVLSHEETDLSLERYTNACLKANRQSPKTLARRVGSYTTKRGLKGELISVERDGAVGRMVCMQLISIHDRKATVLTITTGKSGLAKEQAEIMAIFDSFRMSENPLSDELSSEQATLIESCLKSVQTKITELAKLRCKADQIDQHQISTLRTELCERWRQSPEFSSELWPAYCKLLEKHFSDRGPIWLIETLRWSASQLEKE